uniref:Short-chain dehydrogenase/reductase SDR n=1 Tax=Phytophthora ramorum TaxID=164328 RepID=H3HE83_PHYRM
MTSTKKTVLITGSTRGIGLAFAEHYIKAGWDVIGTARANSSTEKAAYTDLTRSDRPPQ